MKKIISILLATAMLCSLAACGNKAQEEELSPEINIEESNAGADIDAGEEATPAEGENAKAPAEDKQPEKPASKPTEKPAEQKPQEKPADTQAQQPSQPAEKPEESKPAEKPAETPAEKPAETPKTIGGIIRANFKANAASTSAEQLAKTVWNSAIPEEIRMVDMPMEPGYLQGFGNNEITGFKSCTIFSPMIGTHPFVGYIFELENAADTSAFISDLRSKANLGWNICTQADEMVTESVGNKVLFVMCPTSFEME